MSFQQLDLFGNPIEPQQPKASAKKLAMIPVVEPIKIVEEKVVANTPIVTGIKSKRGRPRKIISANEKTKTAGKRGRKSYAETYADVDLTSIPDNEALQKKMYYSISEVAGWFNLTASQLRFWENEFDILEPRKNRKGDRLFRPEDINNLKIIYYLLRTKKLSIESAKDYLKANKNKTELQVQLQASLQNFKAFLLELKANL